MEGSEAPHGRRAGRRRDPGRPKELHAKTLAANATQEEAKRKAKEATEAFVALKVALSRATWSALDMAIGAVGKGTVSAKNFQRLRSRIRMPGEQSEATPSVEPLPEA